MKLLKLKKLMAFALVIAFSIQMLQGQALGTWKPYMAYQNATMIEVVGDYVYAVYDGSLLKYKPASGGSQSEIKLMSKVDGLNDVTIIKIAYVKAEKILVLAYNNGNIDLYDTQNGDVYNLADFKNQASDKTINAIDVCGSMAYISVNTGILAIDTKNKVHKDTYKLNRPTYSVCQWGDSIYAATNAGVYRAYKQGNLLTATNWISYNLGYSGGTPNNVRKLLTYKGSLVFYQQAGSNPGVYYQNTQGGTSTRLGSFTAINHWQALDNQLVMVDNTNMYICSVFSSGVTSKTFPVTTPASTPVVYFSFENNSTYWLACSNALGIRSYDYSSNTLGNSVLINSPISNLTHNMTFSHGKLAVVSGFRTIWAVSNRIGNLMVLEADRTWTNANFSAIQAAAIADPLNGGVNNYLLDWLEIIIDPRDKDRYFVTTAVSGVLELKNDYSQRNISYVKLYNHRNTSVLNRTGSSTDVRVIGMAYDNMNNLYILSTSGVSKPIVIFSNNNQWSNSDLVMPTLNYFPTQIYITKTNQKWVVNGEITSADKEGVGLFVVNDRNDITQYLNELVDQDGEDLKNVINYFGCVVEDLNGTIWAGTNDGPIVFYTPSAVTESSVKYRRCSRIKIPRNDGTDLADYLLKSVVIRTIAVDGANRKWIGTAGSGVFLVSPAGDEVIANFTAENSPLLSNSISKIVINNQNGEVFIATDKGLISYTNLATGSGDYSEVYAYPNPVRPDFDGDVVVTGLFSDSNVKITDLTGNLVFQGTSVGGQFSWNCKNRNGERVKTGVYLVFAAIADGTQGVVTKIVVIK